MAIPRSAASDFAKTVAAPGGSQGGRPKVYDEPVGWRRVLRFFTMVIFVTTAIAVWENIFAENAALLTEAGVLARARSGCGEACKVSRLHVDRGMIAQRMEYDVIGVGQVVVVCRRALIVLGRYTCEATRTPL